MEQQALKSQFFLTVITDKEEFKQKIERYLNIIKIIDAMNVQATLSDNTKELKPMYVMVQRGVQWDRFQMTQNGSPWRQIHFFSNDKEFDEAFKKIKEDVERWKTIKTL
jgi:hypothetical protein